MYVYLHPLAQAAIFVLCGIAGFIIGELDYRRHRASA